ncbi:tetratricopeptide repeat protein [Tunturiibacter gelidoferens]|uniref:Tetratricopeptide (TPR) repeat protein n=1 Tax=Tunturiibacter gelidiferens TaxID=3069689 RepID=A0ACC5NVK5_9BACT|nr:tetratricopeptide repeat protein [Edaphobacter lichenicola]MBB5338480.1 tetratricopeptide (TPR) repeat protein [Edaphobacter lichenicola]
MAIGSQIRALLAAFLFSAACHAQTAPAQNPPAPCPASGQNASQPSAPCSPPPQTKKPSAAEQFPFPGTPAKPTTPPPDSPSSTTTPSSAADEHPFPTTPAPRLPGDDSSSSSSSSGADPDAVPDTDMPKPGTEGSSVHRKLPKVKRVQTDDERVDEDLKVARFYMRDDNLPGAYLRAQDAVKTQPDYSAAHYALAEIAQKMKKKDEAIAEFQTYLKLDPDGEKAKEAHKALDQLK